MGIKGRAFAPLVNVSLEDLVPADHFYRHLERMLDLSCPSSALSCVPSLPPGGDHPSTQSSSLRGSSPCSSRISAPNDC